MEDSINSVPGEPKFITRRSKDAFPPFTLKKKNPACYWNDIFSPGLVLPYSAGSGRFNLIPYGTTIEDGSHPSEHLISTHTHKKKTALQKKLRLTSDKSKYNVHNHKAENVNSTVKRNVNGAVKRYKRFS